MLPATKRPTQESVFLADFWFCLFFTIKISTTVCMLVARNALWCQNCEKFIPYALETRLHPSKLINVNTGVYPHKGKIELHWIQVEHRLSTASVSLVVWVESTGRSSKVRTLSLKSIWLMGKAKRRVTSKWKQHSPNTSCRRAKGDVHVRACVGIWLMNKYTQAA